MHVQQFHVMVCIFYLMFVRRIEYHQWYYILLEKGEKCNIFHKENGKCVLLRFATEIQNKKNIHEKNTHNKKVRERMRREKEKRIKNSISELSTQTARNENLPVASSESALQEIVRTKQWQNEKKAATANFEHLK